MASQPFPEMETLFGQGQGRRPDGRALQDVQSSHPVAHIPLLADGVIGSTSTETGKLCV